MCLSSKHHFYSVHNGPVHKIPGVQLKITVQASSNTIFPVTWSMRCVFAYSNGESNIFQNYQGAGVELILGTTFTILTLLNQLDNTSRKMHGYPLLRVHWFTWMLCSARTLAMTELEYDYLYV